MLGVIMLRVRLVHKCTLFISPQLLEIMCKFGSKVLKENIVKYKIRNSHKIFFFFFFLNKIKQCFLTQRLEEFHLQVILKMIGCDVVRASSKTPLLMEE